MSAGLLFVFSFHIGTLADRLTECNLWSFQFNLDLVLREQFALNHLKMLVAHTIEQCLTVLRIIDHFHCQIFVGDLLKCLSYFILVPFVFCTVAFVSIWNGNFDLAVTDRCCLSRKGIAGTCLVEFGDRPDVSGMKLRNLDRFASFKYIQLIQLLFCIFVNIENDIITLDNAGFHFDHRIFSDERIDDRLKYLGGFCFCKIIICFKNLVCLCIDAGYTAFVRTWEILHNII